MSSAWPRGYALPDRSTGLDPIPLSALVYATAVGLGGLGILAWVLSAETQPVAWLSVSAFSILSFLVQRSSFHLGSPVVHSLAGVIDVGAVLALGPIQGAIVAVVSGFSYLSLRALRHRRFALRHWIELPLFNAGLKAAMALLVGLVYRQLGGSYPLDRLDL